MTRIWRLLGIGLAILVLLAGCSMAEEPQAPLRIALDLGITQRRYAESGDLEDACSQFIALARLNGHLEDFEVEYIPGAGQERITALSRLRTEVMAGEGPDVFICACSDPAAGSPDVLFPFPEKAALNGLFLPLDEYIKQAKFMEWDQLTPEVMAAGHTDEGQMILPLTYTFHTTIFDQADLNDDYTGPLTWEQAVASDDPVWKAACDENWQLYFGEMFGQLADFQQEKLAFSEDDLLEAVLAAGKLRMEAAETNREAAITSETFGAPRHTSVRFGQPNQDHTIRLTYGSGATTDPAVDLQSSEQQARMIPLYNREGGVTAIVTAFAAVSRTTKRPGDAFAVVDSLLSKAGFRSALYQNLTGVPVHEELGQALDRYVNAVPIWYMGRGNFEEYNRIRRQINAARFEGPLDEQLWSLSSLLYSDDFEQTRKKVAEAYSDMVMILAES